MVNEELINLKKNIKELIRKGIKQKDKNNIKINNVDSLVFIFIITYSVYFIL